MNDDFVTSNMNLAYYIIQHDYPKFVNDDDIVQSAMLGLVKAANSFDPSKGKFSSYARKFIHGEIKREFKKRDIGVSVISLEALQEKGGSNGKDFY